MHALHKSTLNYFQHACTLLHLCEAEYYPQVQCPNLIATNMLPESSDKHTAQIVPTNMLPNHLIPQSTKLLLYQITVTPPPPSLAPWGTNSPAEMVSQGTKSSGDMVPKGINHQGQHTMYTHSKMVPPTARMHCLVIWYISQSTKWSRVPNYRDTG